MEKVLVLPEDDPPSVLVFIVSCNATINTRRKARARYRDAAVESRFWAGIEPDYGVKEAPDILKEFFGLGYDITVIHQHLPGLEDYVYAFREAMETVTRSFLGRRLVFEAIEETPVAISGLSQRLAGDPLRKARRLGF